MKINTWEDEKQLVRDKIEMLFQLVTDSSAQSLELYVKMDCENAPEIQYKIKQNLVKFEWKEDQQ